MFMRANRAKNGAPQPEAVGAASVGAQRKSRKLSPNFSLEKGEDWRFSPSMSSCDAINDAHYHAGVSDEPFNADYVGHIPYVGMPDNGVKIKEA